MDDTYPEGGWATFSELKVAGFVVGTVFLVLKPTHHRTLAALGLDAVTPEGLVKLLQPWLGLWL